MVEDAPGAEGSFDLDKLRELIELMEKHGLTEVSLRRGGERWRLRRGPEESAAPAGVYGFQPHPPPAAPAPPAPTPTVEPSLQPAADNTLLIKSPTVGTFYSAPGPDEPDFVSVGSVVQPDTVVCVVEAMKVFNQIQADVSGVITEILVKNGDPIEFGQPLFRVRPG